MQPTYSDTAYRSFTAGTPADLVGKEHYLVELVSASASIQLLTSGAPIGVLKSRMESDSQWNTRLIGKGGTVVMIAGGAIAAGAYVKGLSGGKVVTANTTEKAIGVYLGADAAVDGDLIEVLDNTLVVP
jgi:hypothetical protein